MTWYPQIISHIPLISGGKICYSKIGSKLGLDLGPKETYTRPGLRNEKMARGARYLKQGTSSGERCNKTGTWI